MGTALVESACLLTLTSNHVLYCWVTLWLYSILHVGISIPLELYTCCKFHTFVSINHNDPAPANDRQFLLPYQLENHSDPKKLKIKFQSLQYSNYSQFTLNKNQPVLILLFQMGEKMGTFYMGYSKLFMCAFVHGVS